MELKFKGTNLLSFGKIIAVDIISVIEGLKPAMRFNVGEEKVKGFEAFCKNNSLFYRVSDFKMPYVFDSGKGSFCNLRILQSSNDKKPGYYYFYISKSESILNELFIIDKNHKHPNNARIGVLFGYPKCCVGFYTAFRTEALSYQDDYTIISLKKSNPPLSFLANNVQRYFDIAITSHFPCSFNCKHTLAIAKKKLEAIRKYSPEFAKYLENSLRSVITYSEFSGISKLINPSIKKNKIFYNGAQSTANNEITKKIRDGNIINLRSVFDFDICKDNEISAVMDKDCAILDFL